jgi:hypothetical protein
MAKYATLKPLTRDRRKEVFLALVRAQDRRVSVAGSRAEVAEKFRLSELQVRRIEQEGLDAGWPPL